MKLNVAISRFGYSYLCLPISYREASYFSRQTAQAKEPKTFIYADNLQVVCFPYIYLSSLVLHIKILFTTKTFRRN